MARKSNSLNPAMYGLTAAGRGACDPHPHHVQGHGRGRIRADGDRCGIHQSGGQPEEAGQPPRGMKGETT